MMGVAPLLVVAGIIEGFISPAPINPLIKLDGYYMLSDLLEIPNLAEKARKLTQDTFASTCLGIEVKEDAFMPQRGRFWLIAYTIASTIYRWVEQLTTPAEVPPSRRIGFVSHDK